MRWDGRCVSDCCFLPDDEIESQMKGSDNQQDNERVGKQGAADFLWWPQDF